MATPHTGHDGRHLVDTRAAAYSLGMSPSTYRRWAGRHHLKPAAYQPNPAGGQPTALWDLADITQALDKANSAA